MFRFLHQYWTSLILLKLSWTPEFLGAYLKVLISASLNEDWSLTSLTSELVSPSEAVSGSPSFPRMKPIPDLKNWRNIWQFGHLSPFSRNIGNTTDLIIRIECNMNSNNKKGWQKVKGYKSKVILGFGKQSGVCYLCLLEEDDLFDLRLAFLLPPPQWTFLSLALCFFSHRDLEGMIPVSNSLPAWSKRFACHHSSSEAFVT